MLKIMFSLLQNTIKYDIFYLKTWFMLDNNFISNQKVTVYQIDKLQYQECGDIINLS